MPYLTFDRVRLLATIGLAIVALSIPLPAAAQSDAAPDRAGDTKGGRTTTGQRDVAVTAPSNAGAATSGGTTNILGDPKSNRAGMAKPGEPQEKIELSNADRKLMRQLAQAHLAEIKMSALATAISGDTAIRGYGEKMLEEHLTALDELRQLANRTGVVLPGGVEKEHAAVLHQLALKAGDEFDRMYLDQAGFASHEQSHRMFQEASGRAESPMLKAYAARLVPVIGQHLQLARQMRDDPSSAAAAVQATVRAGQSTSIRAPVGSSSMQADSNSGAKGAGSVAGSTTGSGR